MGKRDILIKVEILRLIVYIIEHILLVMVKQRLCYIMERTAFI